MNDTVRILAQDEYMENNTRVTGINNNDLIIGPSGAGKTRYYVKPNIMQGNESVIITDTKGNLHQQLRPLLEEKGYLIKCIDMKNIRNSDGYNPFDYIRYDEKRQKYVEQDILTISSVLTPISRRSRDPFWENAARMYLQCLIAYVVECLPKEEHNLEKVYELYLLLDQKPKEFAVLMKFLEIENPSSLASRTFRLIERNIKSTPAMHGSITAFVIDYLNGLLLKDQIAMYKKEDRIRLEEIGRVKTALFFNVSDVDRSMDTMVGLFYAQALNTLCQEADSRPDSRLQVPVRFILDDFATNMVIPNFDGIISVIRSREIYVSIILQSISQLQDLYGENKAETIVNNCDNCLYLGGQDVETATYMAQKLDKSINTILNMPLTDAALFTRGREPKQVKTYNIEKHPDYGKLLEAKVD